MKYKAFFFFIFVFGSAASADELQYFNDKIDFWGDSTGPKLHTPSPELKGNEKKDGAFPWKTYLDPKNKEFFKEGDYTPPEPFMELARNPTDENIKNWFDLMKQKNLLARRLEVRMAEYLSKSGGALPVAAIPTEPTKKTAPVEASPLDPTRFKIRMYFESTCPHCRRMFGVLKQLQEEGVEVHALQMDSGKVPVDEQVVPIGKAESADIKKHGINGVPFLLIADLKRKALLSPIQGFHDFKEMMALLKSASR